MQPPPVFLPGITHRQESLAGYSPLGCNRSGMTQWWNKNNKQGCEKGELQTLNGWDCQKSFKNWSFIKSVMLAAAYRQQEIREQTGRLVRRLWSVIQAKDGAFQISEWQWEWWEGVIVYSISCVQLFATPWTVACQALLSMGYRRQEYWSVLLFLSSGDLPKSGIESTPPAFPGGFFTIEPQGKPRKELVCVCVCIRANKISAQLSVEQ